MPNTILKKSILLAATVAPLPLHAQEAIGRAGGGYGMWDWNWGHTLAGHLPMVLLWLAVFAVIVFAVRRLGRQGREAPLDILRQRYARGEINNGEFEERRRLLSN